MRNAYGGREPAPSIVSSAPCGSDTGDIFVTFGASGSCTVKIGPVVEPATVTLTLPGGSDGTTTTCAAGGGGSTCAAMASNVTLSVGRKREPRTRTCWPGAAVSGSTPVTS